MVTASFAWRELPRGIRLEIRAGAVLRQKLAPRRGWLRGLEGLRGFWAGGVPAFSFCRSEADQSHVPELLEPFRGLADPAIASLSPDQEGEVELWLLEQSADFLPSM